MDNMVEIIKEARKAGMQTALILFGALCVVASLFAFYIYQSYQPNISTSLNLSKYLMLKVLIVN